MNTEPKLELPKSILQLTKHEPTNESLLILRNYDSELECTLHAKEKCLEELNSKKGKKEIDIKFVECLINGKDEELQNVNQLQESDTQIEEEWIDRMKCTRKNSITSIEEYQNKMAEYRKQLLSSTGIDDELLNEKINQTEQRKINLVAEIESMEKHLAEIQDTVFDCKKIIEQQISMIQILIHHCEKDENCEAQIMKFEHELRSVINEIECIQSKPE